MLSVELAIPFDEALLFKAKFFIERALAETFEV